MFEGITAESVFVFVAIGLTVAVAVGLRNRAAARSPANAGAQLFPGGLADAALQSDVWEMLLVADQLVGEGDVPEEPCRDRRVASVEILGELGVDAQGEWDGGPWTEQWTVDRCGALVPYTIEFSRAADGGTAFSLRKQIAVSRPEDRS